MPAYADEVRDDLVGEVDLALAALRRVLIKAIEMSLSSSSASPARRDIKPLPTVRTAAAAPPRQAAGTVTLQGVRIDLDSGEIEFAGRTAELSRRQAQLAAVLLKASPAFIGRDEATARAWPDLAASSRLTTVAEAARELTERCAPIGVVIKAERGYGLRLSLAGKP